MKAKLAIRAFLIGVILMAGVAIWRINYLIIVVPAGVFISLFLLAVANKIRHNG